MGTSELNKRTNKDKFIVTMLSLSQLGFIFNPLFFGIIIPLAIWISKKDKIDDVARVGKSILNFQITWTIVLIIFCVIVGVSMISQLDIIQFSTLSIYIVVGVLYAYNLIIIIINTILYIKVKKVRYIPAFSFIN